MRAVRVVRGAAAVPFGETVVLQHGRYLVETVAGCGNCHTPRLPDGNPDPTKNLAGAFVIEEPVFKAYAQNITPASADVTVQAEVENDYDSAKEAEVTSEVKDAGGHVVLTVTDKGTLQPGEKHQFIASGALASPKMWSPCCSSSRAASATMPAARGSG